MKFKYTFLPLLLFLLLGVTACNADESKCPIEVSTEHYANNPNFASEVKVLSLVDSIVIQGVNVNRGNVKATYWITNPVPHTLKYGTAFMTRVAAPQQNIKEVEVQTDQGSWTFTFK